MKLLTTVLILISGISLVSCLREEKPDSQINSKSDNLGAQTNKPDSPPILEINENAVGMFSITGKSLFFQLFENGHAEWEIADQNKLKEKPAPQKIEEVGKLRSVNLSREEMLKFENLLKSQISISRDYQRKCCCTDAFLFYKIKISNKDTDQIFNLDGICALSEIKNPPEKFLSLPPQLSELITLADNIRLKYAD